MELEELIDLDQLQDLQQSMEPDMYPDDILAKDHLMLMICRAQQEEEDDQQLMQAHIAGFLSSRCNIDQSFPDRQQFDHSDQELAGTAEMGCKWLIRSSFDHSNFVIDQLNYAARGGLKEPDDDQKDAAGTRSNDRLHHTAGGRSRLLDDQKSAGTRSKCLKRSNQYNFLNDENDQYDLIYDQSTSFTQNNLINDQKDHSAAAASSEEEGGMISCSSNSSMKKKKKKKKEKNLQRCSSTSAHQVQRHQQGSDAPQAPITPRVPTSGIAPALQYRRPIIIHTYPPKIIHTHPSKFMWLVQSLTGSSETRSRCLKSQPSEYHDQPLHDQHRPAGSPASSAGSIEAQLQTASAKTADQHCLSFHQLAGGSAASPQPPLQNSHVITPKPIRYHQANNVINPFKNHINQSLNNVSTNYNHPSLISPKTPTNHLPNLINYKDQCSRMSEGAERGCTSGAISASCCTSTKIEGNFSATEVSPRGPLISATETEANNIVLLPPPAPNFDNWSLELHHRSISNPKPNYLTNLNLNPNANYLMSNVNPKLNHLSNLNPKINVVPRSQGLIKFNSLSSDYLINHGPSSSREELDGLTYNHGMGATTMWGIGQHPAISLSVSGK